MGMVGGEPSQVNKDPAFGDSTYQLSITISVAVMDGKGKLIMECVLETKAATILEFMQGLHGNDR